MSEMVLLGAGASVEAGVPDSYAMTGRIVRAIREARFSERHADVISFVLGGLLFQAGIRGDNPLECGVNVEELFNAVLLLSERHTLEAAPFIGSWHNMVEEFDRERPRGADPNKLHHLIFESVSKEILNAMSRSRPPFGGQDIDRKLTETVRALHKNSSSSVHGVGDAVEKYVTAVAKQWCERLGQSRPSSSAFAQEFRQAVNQEMRSGEGRIFEAVCEHMIRTLADIVWIDDAARVGYLSPLLGLLKTQGPLTVATLNYDNSIEKAAERAGVRCSTGIDEWSATGEFQPETDLLLLKLHGSIDWAAVNLPQQPGMMPHYVIQCVPGEKVKSEGFRPAVIFGQRNKLTAEGPFLDLLRAFQRELVKTARLTVIGYSFRDQHINLCLSKWLNRDSSRQLRIIDPKWREYATAYHGLLLALGSTRIEVVETNASEGIRACFGESAEATGGEGVTSPPAPNPT